METQTYDIPNKAIVITTTAVQTITQTDLQRDIDGATATVAAAQANLTQTEADNATK